MVMQAQRAVFSAPPLNRARVDLTYLTNFNLLILFQINNVNLKIA